MAINFLDGLVVSSTLFCPPSYTMKPEANTEYEAEYTSIDLRSYRRKRWNVLSFSLGCASTIILFVIAFFARHAVNAPKSAATIEAEEWNYCGRSSTIAKSRGCVMEPMFYGWMPPRCVYQELTTQYPVFEDRKYYSDVNLTQELQPHQLWDGEYAVVYTSRQVIYLRSNSDVY